MPGRQLHILIVDDAEENRFMLETLLEDDFKLSFAVNGQGCLDGLSQNKPDLVLLDVTMPDMSGLEVCQQVKNNQNTADIPIIFVSGLVTADERLAGFEAGGDEYITKPVDEQDLLKKIETSLAARTESLKLKTSADDAMNIAMEAMVSSSELGVLNQFMRDSALAGNYSSLGESLLVVTRHFGLNCCIQFRSSVGIINISCNDDSLEAKLLTKFQGGEKIIDFGARTILNSEQAALLIKNMPVNDEAKYGRLKDHLSVLIDTLTTKVNSLEIVMNATQQRDILVGQLVENNDIQLEDIRTKIDERDQFTLKIMQEVISGVEEQLFSLGLEDDQEKLLMKMLDSGLTKVDNLPSFTAELEASFASARDNLVKLLNT